jgi:hypothetical protein
MPIACIVYKNINRSNVTFNICYNRADTIEVGNIEDNGLGAPGIQRFKLF